MHITQSEDVSCFTGHLGMDLTVVHFISDVIQSRKLSRSLKKVSIGKKNLILLKLRS